MDMHCGLGLGQRPHYRLRPYAIVYDSSHMHYVDSRISIIIITTTTTTTTTIAMDNDLLYYDYYSSIHVCLVFAVGYLIYSPILIRWYTHPIRI